MLVVIQPINLVDTLFRRQDFTALLRPCQHSNISYCRITALLWAQSYWIGSLNLLHNFPSAMVFRLLFQPDVLLVWSNMCWVRFFLYFRVHGGSHPVLRITRYFGQKKMRTATRICAIVVMCWNLNAFFGTCLPRTGTKKMFVLSVSRLFLFSLFIFLFFFSTALVIPSHCHPRHKLINLLYTNLRWSVLHRKKKTTVKDDHLTIVFFFFLSESSSVCSTFTLTSRSPSANPPIKIVFVSPLQYMPPTSLLSRYYKQTSYQHSTDQLTNIHSCHASPRL